ncbi:hypothetical protein B0H10DRAFT_2214430 [Mycena sp. CBHHK59/15]|nr:hypothetical protein B0H10DRAFT_2214430 [Mycena sp. CBHHK59/15]
MVVPTIPDAPGGLSVLCFHESLSHLSMSPIAHIKPLRSTRAHTPNTRRKQVVASNGGMLPIPGLRSRPVLARLLTSIALTLVRNPDPSDSSSPLSSPSSSFGSSGVTGYSRTSTPAFAMGRCACALPLRCPAATPIHTLGLGMPGKGATEEPLRDGML